MTAESESHIAIEVEKCFELLIGVCKSYLEKDKDRDKTELGVMRATAIMNKAEEFNGLDKSRNEYNCYVLLASLFPPIDIKKEEAKSAVDAYNAEALRIKKQGHCGIFGGLQKITANALNLAWYYTPSLGLGRGESTELALNVIVSFFPGDYEFNSNPYKKDLKSIVFKPSQEIKIKDDEVKYVFECYFPDDDFEQQEKTSLKYQSCHNRILHLKQAQALKDHFGEKIKSNTGSSPYGGAKCCNIEYVDKYKLIEELIDEFYNQLEDKAAFRAEVIKLRNCWNGNMLSDSSKGPSCSDPCAMKLCKM